MKKGCRVQFYWCALMIAWTFSIHAQTRPSNDDLSQARVLPADMIGQPQTYSSLGATSEPGEPAYSPELQGVPAVWWKWKPNYETYATLHTGNSRMALFRSGHLGPLTLYPIAIFDPATMQPTSRIFDFNLYADLSPNAVKVTISGDLVFAADPNWTYWIADVSSTSSNTFTIRQYIHSLRPYAPIAEAPMRISLSEYYPAPLPNSLELKIDRIEGGTATQVLATNYNLSGPDFFWTPATAGHHVGSSRVDLQACKLEYSIVSPK